MRTPPRLASAVLGCSLALLACGSSSTTETGELTAGPTVKGVVVGHDGRAAVSGATVLGFYRDGNDGSAWYTAQTPTTRTTTNATGAFEMHFRPGDRDRLVGVQISIPLDSGDNPSTARFQVRSEVWFEQQNVIALPGPLRACDGPESECGTVLLPDLTPIATYPQIEPDARARLERERALLDATDDHGILPTETWFVTEEDGRRLLRFASLTANVGPGPLEIVAAQPSDNGTVRTHQRLWTDTWTFRDIRAGEFVFHEGHDHTHFNAFEQYRLIDQAGSVVAESAKISFCLRDSIRVQDTPLPVAGLFTDIRSCGATQQAINPGFGDHYDQFLPDQWIDITNVAAGEYTVEITVDPLDQIAELDETNNQATFPITIEPR